MQVRRHRGAAAAAVRLPQPPSIDRIRVSIWGTVAAVNLMTRATSPHLLFIGLRDGGPLASYWAGPPIRARGQGISWPLGQLVELNFNTTEGQWQI